MNGGMRVVTAANLESNELLRSVMEVALQRIRSNNSQFTNAVFTRAHIRIVGNNRGAPNPLSLRRLIPDFGSLYNNSH